MLIVRKIIIEFWWTVFRTLLCTYIHDTILMELQKCPQEPRKWARKAIKQSADNRPGRAMDATEWPPWLGLPGIWLCVFVQCGVIFRIIPELQLIFSTRNIWITYLKFYRITVWIPVCLHAKGLVWINSVSCEFYCLKIGI